MKKALLAAVLATAMAAPLVPAQAQYGRHDHDNRGADYNWRGDRNDRNWDPAQHYHQGNYRERRLGRNDRVYRGNDGRYYCRRSDGSTGLVIGALAGGVLGNAIGGDTLSTILGAGAGGLLGRSVDRGEVRCR